MATKRSELGEGWTLRPADEAVVPDSVRAAGPVPATVPGSVHTDLLAAGLIPDPYLDRNEIELAWISRAAWIYERTLEHRVVGSERVVLAFAGLDTVATVAVNGTVVAQTRNMHRRYEVPVDLRDGRNELSVRFESALAYAEAERDRLGELPNQYPDPFNFVRKMACNFGWDWGPSLVTAGIWRPVTLIRHSGPRLAGVRPYVRVTGLSTFDIRLAERLTEPVLVRATVGSVSVTCEIPVAVDRATVDVHVEDPALWWPVGLGEQPLYDAAVSLCDRTGAVLDTWADRIGFRSVRLDTTPDAEGTPFVIVVNDVPVPIRGANWIPDDCFPARVTEERIRTRIGQAVDANMNLLRVWGGGVYESDEFYRSCDERGILVWQDFLFACAAYPEDEPLAGEIDAEARDNVARLMGHPSLVLWNGNNENIWGFADWDWQRALGGRPWGLRYYLDVLPRAVAETDPGRPYWPGSPYSGSMDTHPNDDDHATSHVWDVWNAVDYTAYRDRRPRFVAEFGWQAPPTWSTLSRSIHDDPLTPTSPGMAHHQKAEDGHGKLTRGLAPHFPEPVDIVDWVFASQLNQARAIALGVEHFRALRPRCAGAIVWQLNDCWPVTSWSAVDGDGRRKPLWYALRDAFRPRLLTIQPGPGGLALVAVNDTRSPWAQTVTVRRLSFDGRELAVQLIALNVEPLGVARTPLSGGLALPSAPTEEFLVAGDRTFWFFAEDRDLAYRPAALDVEVARDGTDVVLTLGATTLVRDVCVFADRVEPSAEADECLVTLVPGVSRTIRVRGVPDGWEDALLRPPVLRSANDLILSAESVHR